MAAVPCQLTAVYDDATSTLTISATLPPPEPPTGYQENETWWTLGSPSVSVDVRVSRKTPLSGGFAYYLKADAEGRPHKYRVEWTQAGGWAMPGVEVPYP